MPSESFRVTANASRVVADVAEQLARYFAGTLREFRVTFDDVGATDFQRDVWNALIAVPYGTTRTYGEIAAALGRPRATRAVGNANHANPWPILVPCHRVVAANGLGGYGGGLDVKRYLLSLESRSR
ncbi:MAG: methylated-DNA--[protein]-cysteine S-methyltransferase [Acidobacteriota bacterium]|nr:methylated-DNA--[protein]-cysteine S-methyltransferase [Acidobacteriota bacterium]